LFWDLLAVLMSSIVFAGMRLFNLFSCASLDYFEDKLALAGKLVPLIWLEVPRVLCRLRATFDDYFLEFVASNFLILMK
jgi:hypothetical protein